MMKIWMQKGLLLLGLIPFFGTWGFLAGMAYLIYYAIARSAPDYVTEEGGSGVFYGGALAIGGMVYVILDLGVQNPPPWMLGGAISFFICLISCDKKQKRMEEAAEKERRYEK